MFCSKCHQSNPANATECIQCQQPTDYFRRRIFIGAQFVFITATTDQPVAVSVDGTAQTFTAPAIISRHLHAVSFGDDPSIKQKPSTLEKLLPKKQPSELPPLPDQPKLSTPTLNLLTVVSDRKIYKPDTPANLFVVAPDAANQPADLEILLAGQKIYRATITLNAEGLAQHTFENTREGEYQAIVSLPQSAGLSANCTFSVAEFTLSPLIATLTSHKFDGQTLYFSLNLLQLSVPYSGQVEFGLQCTVCGEQVVATQTVTAANGHADGQFNISGHGGPFHVQIVTPTGNTAAVAFPGTATADRQRVKINPLGKTAEISLLPWENSQPTRGLHLGTTETAMTPLMLENAHAATGTLKAASAISQVQVCLFNPRTGQSRILNHTNLNRGETIPFEVDAPYTLFTVGALTAKGNPFEGWGIVIKPIAFEAALTAPQTAAPGDEIALELTGPETGGYCWLLVYDARLEHESPLPNLAKQIYHSARNATGGLQAATVDNAASDRWSTPPVVYRSVGTGVLRTMSAPPLNPFAAPPPSPVFAPSPQMKMSAPDNDFLAAEAMPRQAELEEDKPVLTVTVAPTRMDFPELIYLELFYFAGQASRTIKLGDQIGTWRARAYVGQNADYRELTADIQADKPLYAELDLPAIASPGDRITAAATYFTRQAATLTISTADGQTSRTVTGSGTLPFTLSGPGKIDVRLENETGTDWSVKEVLPPGVQRVTASELLILDKNQTVQGEKIVVYPSMGHVLKDTITALINYPFGCAEQTSSALYGLAIAYRGITGGIVPGDLATTESRILAGLQRLFGFQHGNGLYSLWGSGTPGIDLTAKVTHRLLGLRGLPFPAADSMLDKAKTAMLKANHHDNALLPLDAGFAKPMLNPEDAVAYYFAPTTQDRREQALTLLQNTAQPDGSKVYWQAQTAWGGRLEVTADAARVVADAGNALFKPAFSYVTGKMVNGMLYSTADTRALVELLASLKINPADRAIIDGQEVSLGDVSTGNNVTALTDGLIVRVDKEIEINHLDPRADFQFTVKPAKTNLITGERSQITITPNEETIAPCTRIFLPGNLAFLKGGANAQTAYLAIQRNSLTVDVVAVRPGSGSLFVSIHDMYDAEKVGTIPGIEITVK